MADKKKSPLQQFSDQSKYIRKFDHFMDTYNNSTDINHNFKHFRVGQTVFINEEESNYGGLKGKIVAGFSKEKDKLRIKFKNGKSAFVDKFFVERISYSDYEDDKEV